MYSAPAYAEANLNHKAFKGSLNSTMQVAMSPWPAWLFCFKPGQRTKSPAVRQCKLAKNSVKRPQALEWRPCHGIERGPEKELLKVSFTHVAAAVCIKTQQIIAGNIENQIVLWCTGQSECVEVVRVHICSKLKGTLIVGSKPRWPTYMQDLRVASMLHLCLFFFLNVCLLSLMVYGQESQYTWCSCWIYRS